MYLFENKELINRNKVKSNKISDSGNKKVKKSSKIHFLINNLIIDKHIYK